MGAPELVPNKWDALPIDRSITPIALTQAVMGSDPQVAKRAFEAMMQMGKIDVAAIEAAVKG